MKSCQDLKKFLSGFVIYNIRKTKLDFLRCVRSSAVFALMNNVKPEQLDVNMYSIAKKTIHSPIKIEDKVTTDKKKKPLQKLKINIHIKVSINKTKLIL